MVQNVSDADASREPLVAERRVRIADLVRTRGAASVDELARILTVSPSTVRRDLLWLARHDAVSRTWGGALPTTTRPTEDIAHALPPRGVAPPRAMIAKAAAGLIKDGDAVVIDAGATAQLMAPHLLDRHRLTVITTSLPLAWQLRGHPNVELIVTGGHVQTRENSLVGMLAEQTLEQLYVDLAFIGVHGVTPVNGLTNRVLEEVSVKRLMLKIAKRSVALADSSKWGEVLMGLIAPVTAVNIIVTDSNVPGAMRGDVELLGTEVLVAK